MKALIIGGGIIGNAVAWRLARAGLDVTILERGRAGQEASWAAAGMIAPQVEVEGPGPFLRFCVEAKQAFEALLPELIAQSGIDPEYDDASGVIYAALERSGSHRTGRARRMAARRGLQVEEMSGEDARALVPALSPRVNYALHFPNENRLENRRLTQAYLIAALRAGATLRGRIPR